MSNKMNLPQQSLAEQLRRTDHSLTLSNSILNYPLGLLSAQQLNFLLPVFYKIDPDDPLQPVILYLDDFQSLVPSTNKRHLTRQEISDSFLKLKSKLFEANLSYIAPDGDEKAEELIHLFWKMRIEYTTAQRTLIDHVTLCLDKAFISHFQLDGKGRFFPIEFAEFYSLQSKYSKLLYLKLRAWRSTGKWVTNYQSLKDFLNINGLYKRKNDVDRLVKRCVEELSWEGGQTELFKDYHGAQNAPFPHLEYKVEKNRGGKGYTLTFTFSPKKKKKVRVEKNQIIDLRTGAVVPKAEQGQFSRTTDK